MTSGIRVAFLAVLVVSWFAGPITASDPEVNYIASIEEWKVKRAEGLTSETGWPTIVGFHWLEPGATSFGADPENAMILPSGPARAGVLYLEEGENGVRVDIEGEPGVVVLLNDVPMEGRSLLYEAGSDRVVVSVDQISFWILSRAGKLAVRIRDPESPLRKNFTGIDCFPIDQRYRVIGQLKPEPKQLLIPNIMGYEDSATSPGPVSFTLPDGTFELYPFQQNSSDSTELFFMLEDKTSGIETYGGGRYFYSVLEPDGTVLLDFNKFYNPPCVFSPFATCGLPPEENRLPIAVRVGEKQYAGSEY